MDLIEKEDRDFPQALVARSAGMVEDNQKVRIFEPNCHSTEANGSSKTSA
jgi:hypothetical protein